MKQIKFTGFICANSSSIKQHSEPEVQRARPRSVSSEYAQVDPEGKGQNSPEKKILVRNLLSAQNNQVCALSGHEIACWFSWLKLSYFLQNTQIC